jgi:hypothetical protein
MATEIRWRKLMMAHSSMAGMEPVSKDTGIIAEAPGMESVRPVRTAARGSATPGISS